MPGDIARIAAQTGTPFDAILGWPWFAGRRVTLDFASATLQVGEAPMQDAPIALSLQNDRLPLLDVAIDGTPARALFDTGAPTCNIDTSFSARTGALERHRLAIGNRTFELDFRVKDLSRMRQGTGAVAVIGLNLMLGRTIAIDGPDRRIAIGPRRMGDTRPAAQLSE